jgi:hypothetical protein
MKSIAIAFVSAVVLAACAPMPPQPRIMAGEPVVDLKGDFKRRNQEQLDADLMECRDLAAQVAAKNQGIPGINTEGFALRQCLAGRGWKVLG